MNRLSHRRWIASALVAATVVGAGCSDGGSDGDAGSANTITVSDAWVRPTPPETDVAAFYLTAANDGEAVDQVIGTSSPRCAQTMIHLTTEVDGVASMAPADPTDLDIDPGASLVMDPSGLHVMCMGLDEAIVEGQSVPLTINFAGAGSITISAEAANR